MNINDELQTFAYMNTLYTLQKDDFFISFMFGLVFLYMKTTHRFVNIFHVSYERFDILRCVFGRAV